MGLCAVLSERNQVVDSMHGATGLGFPTTARLCLAAEIFFASVKAPAETGEIVNIGGTGNRVAGSPFGHDKVSCVVGQNKVAQPGRGCLAGAPCAHAEEPRNAARHGFKTPCAVRQDRCHDCDGPDRICSGQIAPCRRMRLIDREVVLIGQDLGFWLRPLRGSIGRRWSFFPEGRNRTGPEGAFRRSSVGGMEFPPLAPRRQERSFVPADTVSEGGLAS